MNKRLQYFVGLAWLVIHLGTAACQAQEPKRVPGPTPEPAKVEAVQNNPADAKKADAKDGAKKSNGVFDQINDALAPVDAKFGVVNGYIGAFIFFPIPLGGGQSIQLAVAILILGATYFTFYMSFISIRGFYHAITVIAGKYDDHNDTGDVSHFQALTTALSATVGLGNIAGVTTAIVIGGPGAVVWLVLAGFLGMTSKFVECTLGQKYRKVRSDGTIMGGAMYYLSDGLKELGLGPLGKILGIAFAILCIGGSFAGGNSYQVNGSLGAVKQIIPQLAGFEWLYGVVMVIITAIVIIGGIKRIAATADKIVPIMCSVYLLAGLAIIIKNYHLVPGAFSIMLQQAFTPDAYRGGFLGVLIWGFKRAAFSNEAGVGSAAIAHAAAKTEYPVREGIVALLEPFVDTILVCTMTALVIVITGAYDYKNPNYNPDMKAQINFKANGELDSLAGPAAITAIAMDSQIPGFKYVLAFATFLFAYSTMISWSYYGERCWSYLFGDGSSIWYKIIFLMFTFMARS